MKNIQIPELIKVHKVLACRNAFLEHEIKFLYKEYIAKKEEVELIQFLFDNATKKFNDMFESDVSFQKYVELKKKSDELLTLYVKAKDMAKKGLFSSLVANKSNIANIASIKNQILECEKTLSQFSNHEIYKKAYNEFAGWDIPLNCALKECEKRKSVVVQNLEELKSNNEKIGEIRINLEKLLGKEKLNKKLPYKEKQIEITL